MLSMEATLARIQLKTVDLTRFRDVERDGLGVRPQAQLKCVASERDSPKC